MFKLERFGVFSLLWVTVGCGPSVTSVSPGAGWPGETITIDGAGFGGSQGVSQVLFDGRDAGLAEAWSNSQIRLGVPAGASTGPLVVKVNDVASAPVDFIVTQVPLPSVRIGTDVPAAPSELPASQSYLTCGPPGQSGSLASAESNNSQRAWALADLNADGKVDLVRGGGRNNLCRNLGDGQGRFHDVECVQAVAGVAGVAAGRFNADGYPDVVFTVQQPVGAVGISLSDGSGGLWPPAYFSTLPGTSPDGVVVADFDRDGKLDAAVLTGAVQLLRGDGTGRLGTPTEYAVGDAPKNLAVADFDKDGYPDLAVTNGGSIANGVGDFSVLLNDRTGGFKPEVRFASDSSPWGVVAEDFNSDGSPDVAVAHEGLTPSNNVVTFLGDGHGGLVRTFALPFVGAIEALQSADFNGDGIRDLVAGGSAHLWVLLGYGNGAFYQSDASYALAADTINAGDVNGDGRDDMVAAGSGGTAVALGDGAGHLGTATVVNLVPNPTYPLGWAPGDFNRDGHPDLVVQTARVVPTSGLTEAYELQTLLSDGTGGVTKKITGVSEGTSPLVSADFNGDGKLDVLRAVRTGGIVEEGLNVLLGDGTGAFSPFGSLTDLRLAIIAIAAGDVNEDGRADAVISSGPGGNLIEVFGNADGTLSGPQAISPAEPAASDRALALADLNGDHHLDLIQNGSGYPGSPGRLRVFLGDGGGGFAQSAVFVTMGGEVAVGDVNGDGKPDLVQHDDDSDTLQPPASYRASLGNGLGGFASPIESPFLGRANGLGDFDGDGSLDLVATAGFDYVRIALGDGSGRFVAQPDCYTATFPQLGFPFNFNDDAYMDFVQADGLGNLIQYLGGPGGEFLDYGS